MATNLTNCANYFGLWWSAGDSHNVLYSYNNTLLAEYTTADVVSHAAGCKNTTPSFTRIPL